MESTQIRTTQFYDGTTDDVFKITHDPVPPLKDGEVKLRVEMISLDPAMRGWMTNVRSYIEPVQPGNVMRCLGVAEVIESASDKLAPGDWVTGLMGVETIGVVPAHGLAKVMPTLASPSTLLGGLGITGQTAYFGMLDIGEPKEGETVLVSAASGAVGSVACQIAKLKGARVVGIAGGPDKCAYLVDELKLDGAIDYKTDDLRSALKRECPKGVDVFFDNVGGDTLNAVLPRMRHKGRVVMCGAISQYDNIAKAEGPKSILSVISQSLRVQGFTMNDYMHRVPEAFQFLLQAMTSGDMVFREHIVEGIENFPDALQMLFTGQNHGKLMLKVAQ